MATATRSGLTVMVDPTVTAYPPALPQQRHRTARRRPSPRVRRVGRVGAPSTTTDRRMLVAVVLVAATVGAMNVDDQPAAAAPPVQTAVAPADPGQRNVRMISGRVTSGFGARWGTSHQGLDIAAPIGTPIHAPLPGEVISSGPAQGFGLWVRLRHPDGTITVYGHINRSLVKVGQKVAAGQLIAEVGNRGQSTGPHLHIGVMVGGHYINPRPWLDQRRIRYTP